MTLWGEPEWVHFLNVEQLHVNGCHQNVTEHSTTLGHRISHKSTHVHSTRLLWVGLSTMFLRLLALSKIKRKSANYDVPWIQQVVMWHLSFYVACWLVEYSTKHQVLIQPIATSMSKLLHLKKLVKQPRITLCF